MLTFGIDWDDVISPLNDCAIETGESGISV